MCYPESMICFPTALIRQVLHVLELPLVPVVLAVPVVPVLEKISIIDQQSNQLLSLACFRTFS